MPKHLLKYTFPVVRGAINKVGPPREIAKVASPQRGPFLVTLAVSLSADCATALAAKLEAVGEEPLPWPWQIVFVQALVPAVVRVLEVKNA